MSVLNQQNTYQTLFESLRMCNMAHLSPNLPSFFQRMQALLVKNMSSNEWSASFPKELDNQFKRLDYPFDRAQGPSCSKNIQKFFICYECTKNKNSPTTSICTDCFVMDNHKGHNFRYVQTTLAVCDCGDAESLHQQCFCSKHRQHKKLPPINSKVQETFINQMQLSIFMLLSMAQITGAFTDDSKKKEAFGLAILKKINQFIGKSYTNKIMATNLMGSKLNALLPPLLNEDPQSCILHLLSKLGCWGGFSDKLSELILPLYTVKEMRVLVIGQIFKFIQSKKCFFNQKNALGKVIFQYFHAQSTVEELLQKYSPLVMGYSFSNMQDRYKGYLCFYTVYYHLLCCPNQLTIAELLLSGLNITWLAQFYVGKMQKTSKEQFYNLQLLYFKVVAKLIKIIVQSSRKEELLGKIIKDCYWEIKRKDSSPSFSLERTFALALFASLQYDLQNIYDLTHQTILEFFPDQDETTIVQTINSIIKKSFAALKLQNFSEFKRIVQKDITFELGPKFLIGIDQIYTKIWINLLLKFEEWSEDENFRPLWCYIDSRSHSLEVLFELFKVQEIAQLESTITTIFLEISTIINYYVFLVETSLYELIATDWLAPGKLKQHEIFQLFSFLAYVYDPSSVKEFQTMAGKYIKNDSLIEEYVRSRYEGEKREFERGRIASNSFNLSYKSNYVDFKSYKENNTMYELKLRKYRRTQISRLIFSHNMSEYLIQLFNTMLQMYSHHFKFNQIPSTKIIITALLQTLILLALQTKNQIFDEAIDAIINSQYIEDISSEYSRHLIEMYTLNKSKIKQEKCNESKVIDKIEPNKKRAKEKLAQKMNQIKNQQKKILSNNTTIDEPAQDQSGHQCIVCREGSIRQRLYYLSHSRFSNVSKTCKSNRKSETNQAMLVISTCGHTAHMDCLKKSLEIEEVLSEQFEISCFFCKAYSNSLFPIITPSSHNHLKQIEHYLTKYASFILTLMEENKQLSKKINYQAFNLQQIIFDAISESIYWYGLHFPKYLATKILPIAQQTILLFKILKQQIRGNLKQMYYFDSFKHPWINLVRNNLSNLIEYDESSIEGNIKDGFNEFADKQGLKEKQDLDRFFIIFMGLSSTKPINIYEMMSKHGIKERFNQFYSLPEDLLQLNKEIGKCPTCKKPTSKIVICFLCSFKTCQQCEGQIVKHVSFHFTACIFMRVELGDLYYCLKDDRLSIQSLYKNYAGDQLLSPHIFPQKGKYLLAHDKRNTLYEIAIEDWIENEVMSSNAHSVCQVQ